MTTLHVKVLFALSVMFIVSCDGIKSSIGPALPTRDVTVYLESLGSSKDLIRRVTNLQEMEIDKIQELSTSTNVSARYFIAKNPFTPGVIYERLMADGDEFVRRGAARSRSISKEQALILSQDPSIRVQGALVANPSVEESLILAMRQRNRKIPLTDFAMNIHCPEKIRKEILNSWDSDAKRWLSQKWSAEWYNSPPARLADPVSEAKIKASHLDNRHSEPNSATGSAKSSGN